MGVDGEWRIGTVVERNREGDGGAGDRDPMREKGEQRETKRRARD